jgi:16S rRNA (adenine1518-N6/adenine1519-N6)-dimethyltransferase
LIDGNVVAKIISSVKTRNVLEIGPGPGVLTEALLAKGHFVVAIEKDPDFARELPRLASEGLHVMEADVLDCSLDEIGHKLFQKESFTVVSNLPYHLTTPIIEWLLASRDLFSRAILMLQKEASVRLTAKKGGLLPLLLVYAGDVRYAFAVSKNSFWPQPGVDSAVMLFDPMQRTLLSPEEEESFFAMLKETFSHKRKTILHVLSSLYGREQGERALGSLKISYNTRPEMFSLDDFLRLFAFFNNS